MGGDTHRCIEAKPPLALRGSAQKNRPFGSGRSVPEGIN
jgi:hypothetical protein